MTRGPTSPATPPWRAPTAAAHAPSLVVSWNTTIEQPLAGMQLAREAGRVLVWDTAGTCAWLDRDGRVASTWECPRGLRCAACSDDGSTAVAVAPDGVLTWLDGALVPCREHSAQANPLSVAVSANGDYAVLSGSRGSPHIFDANGRVVERLKTAQPLKHLQFLHEQPWIIGAAEQGLVACYRFDGKIRWEDTFLAPVGGIAASGDGEVILLACFGYGVPRYSGQGALEGTYRVAGLPARITSTYPQQQFAIATTEGQLSVLNYAGQVLWQGMLKEQALDIALDALGRYLIVAYPRGEVVCLHWAVPGDRSDAEPAPSPAGTATPGPSGTSGAARAPGRADRKPEFLWRLDHTPGESHAAVLAVHDRPSRIGVFARSMLEVYDPRQGAPGVDGGKGRTGLIYRSEPITGRGCILCAAPGTIVAATDSRILVYSVRANSGKLFEHRLAQLTNIAVAPLRQALVVVEESDRLSRFALDGERFWTLPLDDTVQDIAVGPDGRLGVTTEAGSLLVVSEQAKILAQWQGLRPEPMLLVATADRFYTLSRQEQVVRAHDSDGKELWGAMLPGDTWRFQIAGPFVLATTPDGQPFAIDRAGRVHTPTAELTLDARPCPGPDGAIDFLVQEPDEVLLQDWEGHVRWRFQSAQPQPGPMAAAPAGIALIRNNQLHWFAHEA